MIVSALVLVAASASPAIAQVIAIDEAKAKVRAGITGAACALGARSGVYDANAEQPPDGYFLHTMKWVYHRLCPKGGCGVVYVARNDSEDNAFAQRLERGTSKISYSERWLRELDSSYGDKASEAILAHELGHHFDYADPGFLQRSDWSQELTADAWAGCYLARDNLRLDAIKRTMRVMARYPSETHPDWPKRFQAIDVGYRKCGGDPLPESALQAGIAVTR